MSQATGLIRGSKLNFLVWFMLLMAAVHCIRSIYFSSVSFYTWSDYVQGKLPMPFQGRIGMMPILGWAEHNPGMLKLTKKYEQISESSTKLPEPMTVEKMASLVTGLVALVLMVGGSAWYASRQRYVPWWLAPALVLVIPTFELGMRSEMNYWYPYDLPHAALFGLACLCILEERWVLFSLLFMVDIPVRETGVFLLLIAGVTWGYRATTKRRIALGALLCGLLVYVIAVRLHVQHLFAGNPNVVGSYLNSNKKMLSVFHWPQLFTAGGYLVLFVVLQYRRLREIERVFLWSCLACVPVTLYFGIWMESRVWLEWTVPIAVLATSEWSSYMTSLGARVETRRRDAVMAGLVTEA
jgi:hypothetical protein